jgi:hypothetical protein
MPNSYTLAWCLAEGCCISPKRINVESYFGYPIVATISGRYFALLAQEAKSWFAATNLSIFHAT